MSQFKFHSSQKTKEFLDTIIGAYKHHSGINKTIAIDDHEYDLYQKETLYAINEDLMKVTQKADRNRKLKPLYITRVSALYSLYTLQKSKKAQIYPFKIIKGIFTDLFPQYDKSLKKEFFGAIIETEYSLEHDRDYSKEQTELTRKNGWSLYMFWEDKKAEARQELNLYRYGIKQSFVQFASNSDDSGKVIIYNKDSEDDAVKLLDGKYSIENPPSNDHIYLSTSEIKSSTYEQDDDNLLLRLFIYFGSNKIEEFGSGIYGKIRDNGSISTGLLLLIKNSEETYNFIYEKKCFIHKNSKPIKDKILPVSRIEDTLTPEHSSVLDYLRSRGQSYIKAPSRIEDFNLTSLKNYLELPNEKYYQFHHITKHEYFISVPLTYSENENEYAKNRNLVLELISQMQIFFDLSKPYSACSSEATPTLYSFNHSRNPEIKYAETQEAILLSDVFILIFPYPHSIENKEIFHYSSAITELGMAMGLKKKIIIISEDGSITFLPKNISKYPERLFLNVPFTSEKGLSDSIDTHKHLIRPFLNLK